MSFDKICMNITNNPNFVSVVRLTTSGIASKMGFNLDEIEDIKVSISEACTNAIKHSKDKEFDVIFYLYDEKLVIEVKDNGIGYDEDLIESPDPNNPKTSGLGLFIIRALMDEVEVVTCDDCGTLIRMTKVVGVDK